MDKIKVASISELIAPALAKLRDHPKETPVRVDVVLQKNDECGFDAEIIVPPKSD
jgi:hypothetical protein